MRTVPRQVAAMAFGDAANAERLVEPKDRAGVGVERIAQDDHTVIVHSDEAAIKCSVEVWGEKDAIVCVEPLGVPSRSRSRA